MTTLLASHRLPSDPAVDQALLNRGLHYGDGLFETILLHQGKLALKQLHLERLNRDAKRLSIFLNLAKVEHELDKFVASLNLPFQQSAIIKIIATRCWGGRGYGFNATTEAPADILFLAYPYQIKKQSDLSVIVCQQRIGINPTLAGIKHLSRLEQVMLSHELATKNADEGVVCDVNSKVIEGVSSNIFAIIDGVCCTPVLAEAGVAGVMRHYLLQTVLPYLKIPSAETSITLEQLHLAQEVFFTNSVKGVLAVSSLANKKYINNSVTKRIQQHLQQEHSHAFG